MTRRGTRATDVNRFHCPHNISTEPYGPEMLYDSSESYICHGLRSYMCWAERLYELLMPSLGMNISKLGTNIARLGMIIASLGMRMSDIF